MELHIFEENSKYGYRDENGTIVIPAKYEEAKDFKENHAVVKYSGFFGVINFSDEPVIDFAYTSIDEHNLFFECKAIQENEPKEKTFWYNRNGALLHEGLANVLSEEFLCISNGKKYGVIDKDGNRIINCLYESILLTNELFVVLRDDKLGLYDLNGSIILDAFCNSIESVIIENDWRTLGNTNERLKVIRGAYYPGFCKAYYFDTDDYPETFLKRERIYVRKDFWGAIEKGPIGVFSKTIEDINKPLIISTDKEKMLFLKSEGIILDNGFEDIQQLTSVSYAVKKNNHWGIYSLETRNFIISIEYDSLRFYGGHTVLLCKDGLWGAKDIFSDEPFYDTYKVSIPTQYLEIAILDDNQSYFGCKKIYEFTGEPCYALVRSDGEEIHFDEYHEFDSQFVCYDYDHFLTSDDGKYGFVSPNGFLTDPFRKEGTNGYTSIPFKYDEVRQREDGRFDIRIGKRWGILSMDGREVTPIKYIESLPSPFDNNIIVQDADSYYFGVLSPAGVEIIPTIYQHLLNCNEDLVGYNDKDLFFYGYGEYKECIDEYNENTYISDFVQDLDEIMWGVVNNVGKRIIEAKYGCYKILPGYIVAGRGGNLRRYPSDALYDLYTKEGEFLIGGFKEVVYDESHELFFFFFGGEFECGADHSYDSYNGRDYFDYYEEFDRGDNLWLILDKDLKTVIRNEKGEQFQFEKGFIGKVEIRRDDEKKTYEYNLPLEYMVKIFSDNIADFLYNSKKRSNGNEKCILINDGSQVLDITLGTVTNRINSKQR